MADNNLQLAGIIAIPTVASYTVPARTPAYRNLDHGSVSAINQSILYFDQVMARAARDDEFMTGPPTTFSSLLDEARLEAVVDLKIKEKLALFATMLLREKFTKRVAGGGDEALKADTVSRYIGRVAFELEWLLKEPTPKFHYTNDPWMKELLKNFEDRYNKDNESPSADSLATLQCLPLFGVIEHNNPIQMLETVP